MGKAKTHSSVSRHLSTRISDRPIDAFVSFYPSDTAAVQPACPIWYLSVFFSFVSLTIRPHCAARILPISFFPRSCRFIPPFHSCVDGGELARRKAARGGGTWRTPRFIPWTARWRPRRSSWSVPGATRRMCEGGGDMWSLRFVHGCSSNAPPSPTLLDPLRAFVLVWFLLPVVVISS